MTRTLAIVLTALTLLAAGCGSDARVASVSDRVPAVAASLDRVDAALASHRFAAARKQLRAMKSAVVEAREAGALGEVDAQRVLDAIGRLMATIPATTTEAPDSSVPSTSPTTGTTQPTESTSRRPSESATSGSGSPVPSATAASSPTPSTTASSSPTTSPTSSPSTGRSTSGAASPRPTAVATPTSGG